MKKILVVDDDNYYVKFLKNKLTELGHQVETAMDGSEGIAVYKRFTPHLMIVDIVMPKKSGYEILEEIKLNHKEQKTKIIVYSNLSYKENIIKAKQLGAHDFITKEDYSMFSFVDVVKRHISE